MLHEHCSSSDQADMAHEPSDEELIGHQLSQVTNERMRQVTKITLWELSVLDLMSR
jgi:hypothetical protein